MPVSRNRKLKESRTHAARMSARNERIHQHEVRERDASEAAKLVNYREIQALVASGRLNHKAVSLQFETLWPDNGILAGLHRRSMKVRRAAAWRELKRLNSIQFNGSPMTKIDNAPDFSVLPGAGQV